MHTEYIKMTVADGAFDVYAAHPAVEPAPVVIVLQEIFGINDDLKETCAELAREGYLALCPDLFWRLEPNVSLSKLTDEEWQKGFSLYQRFNFDQGVKDIAAVITSARTLPGVSGKVGVIGFCMGGLLTYLTAARSNADAAAAYYGGGTDAYVGEAGSIKTPLIYHLAEEDEYISKDAQKTIRDALAGHPQATVYSYPGCNHAFARNGGVHYSAEPAQSANKRTSDFFARTLR